ncbi:DUF3857 domain-containing protein [Flavobacteriaceae bacterium TP-CH-4]|uniref:DUF3857 domain-containing protein n=1 Tax=Pelagihabitans pacificus TaxID=2696054 RepID=A0A967EC56_9FLAO|nr:DUF3857 domain-containing protein [Pelagihabitans pacificus]NHF60916.1 DUF3857 domain-containing protein [Pelagihabitans pacificus]
MRFIFLASSLLCMFVSSAQENKYQALLLDKSLTDNANAVVRLDYMKIHIGSPQKMTYTVRRAVTVMNKRGNRHVRTTASHDKETHIKKIEAFVYDRQGREIEHIKKKDFRDLSAVDGFSLYTDDRLLTFDYTPIQYPYTLEFRYEVETSDTGFFPPWYFLGGYLSSVEKSHYEITYDDPGLKPDIKKYNLEGLSLVEKEEPGQLLFTATNIPAIRPESLSPGFRSIAPRLAVRLKDFTLKGHDASVADWKQLGGWIDNTLLKDRDILNEETIAKVRNLVKGETDDLQKAKIVYKYVQENTRYVSVQIGIGGWKPISAIDVDRVKYGDCKGLSNYTHALLKAVDVASFYTVIHAGERKVDFDSDFARLQGNHAILAIPYKGQYYWIDCTSQVHPFGFVGDFTDDRNALIVTPEGGKIVRTVSYLNEQNYQKTTADYTLSHEGHISGEARIETEGIQYDNHFKLETLDHDEVVKHYKDYWDNINNLKIGTYRFENNRDSIVFTEKVPFNAVNYATLSGDRILFTVNAFNRNSYIPDRYRNRRQPFDIQRGFFDEDEFLVKLPEGFNVEAIPEPKQIDTEFGRYTMRIQYHPEMNTVQYQRSLLIKQGFYPKEKYNLYRDFRKQVARNDNAQIVLVKTNP